MINPPARLPPEPFEVIQVPVHPLHLDETVEILCATIQTSSKGWVIFRDVHGVVRCQDDPEFLGVHRNAMLVCPDGMPLVWIGRRRGHKAMGRVYGPDLMRALMEATRDGKARHYLYGGKPGVAETLRAELERAHPGVNIVGTGTPPFGPLNEEERAGLKQEMASLKPDFFWVGLSTPKQEMFMAEYLGELDVKVMLGVGAAFDYLSGEVKEPPAWLRKSGFQWLARICQEPGRLLGRYLKTVPRFVYLYTRDSLSRNTRPPRA